MRAKKTLSKSDFIKHQIKGLSELTTKKEISNKASFCHSAVERTFNFG